MMLLQKFVSDRLKVERQITICASLLLYLIRGIVSVRCREEGFIGLYIPDDRETSRGPREISRSKGMYNPMHPDSSHSLIIGREVLILTLYVLLTLQGCIS